MTSKFIVEGEAKIEGVYEPTGNKNEALPVVAATLLTNQAVTLKRFPLIQDLITMKQILEKFGVSITALSEHQFVFEAGNPRYTQNNQELFEIIRGSFLLVVPLLYRFKDIKVPFPGGDIIGRRRLDSHLLVMNKFGTKVEIKEKCFHITCNEFKAADVLLDEASVMATENAIMAASIADGISTIYNAACEPHVQGLCRMLNKMGAKISGIGSNLLTIEGVSQLNGCEHTIGYDHTEIGSIIGLAAVLKSQVKIKVNPELDLGLIPYFYEKLGIKIIQDKHEIIIPAEQSLIIQKDLDSQWTKIDDATWPGFPADLISIMIVVATQCHGSILIFEKLFESRLFWIDKLISMGARIVLCDPHRAVVSGPCQLTSAKLNSPDIRAGMALLLATLCAKGKSEIDNIIQIDRGYESIDQRLNRLGTNIQRV